MLTAYFSISVILIVLCAIIAISSVFMASSDTYEYSSSSSSSSDAFKANTVHGSVARLHNIARRLASIGSESSSKSSSESSVSDSNANPSSPDNNDSSSYSYSYSDEEDFATGMIFLFVVVLVLAFFLAYCKIYSLVLAWRLRKMILAAAISLPTEAPQSHEFAPADTSCAVPDSELPAPAMPFQHAPAFAPGFAPYPYPYSMGMPMMMPPHMQGQQFQQFQGQPFQPFPGQQFPGQFPHHVMFGQQPVFYTYAPPSPQTAPSAEEKL